MRASVVAAPGLQSTGSVAAVHWAWLPHGGMWDPGMQPVSPALAGGFFSTEPPGKPPGSGTAEALWLFLHEV